MPLLASQETKNWATNVRNTRLLGPSRSRASVDYQPVAMEGVKQIV